MSEFRKSKKHIKHSEKAAPRRDRGSAVSVPARAESLPPASLPKKLGPRDPQRAAHLKQWRFEKGCKSPNPSGRPRSTLDRFEEALLEPSWRAYLKIMENPRLAADPLAGKLFLTLNKGLIKRLNEKHRNEGLEDGHPSLAEGDPVVVKFLMPPLPPKPEVPKEALVPGTISPGPEGQIE